MGCCASSENVQSSSDHRPGSAASRGPRQTASIRGAQSNHDVNSPSSSRAPLTSVAAGSSVSLPRASLANHRRGATGRQSTNADGQLSSHYNVPLVAPKTWRSTSRTWTRSQLIKERQDFFDTRTGGRREIWEALRQVSECIREGDLTTAQGILDALSITLPTGRLEDGAYDERGELYRISHAVLSDPSNVAPDASEVDGDTVVDVLAEGKGIQDDKQIETTDLTTQVSPVLSDKGKAAIEEDAVDVKCRSSKTGSDTIIALGKSQTVATLHARLNNDLGITTGLKLRIFYLGKELEKRKTLEDQGYYEGHVLNVFVTTAPK